MCVTDNKCSQLLIALEDTCPRIITGQVLFCRLQLKIIFALLLRSFSVILLCRHQRHIKKTGMGIFKDKRPGSLLNIGSYVPLKQLKGARI